MRQGGHLPDTPTHGRERTSFLPLAERWSAFPLLPLEDAADAGTQRLTARTLECWGLSPEVMLILAPWTLGPSLRILSVPGMQPLLAPGAKARLGPGLEEAHVEDEGGDEVPWTAVAEQVEFTSFYARRGRDLEGSVTHCLVSVKVGSQHIPSIAPSALHAIHPPLLATPAQCSPSPE